MITTSAPPKGAEAAVRVRFSLLMQAISSAIRSKNWQRHAARALSIRVFVARTGSDSQALRSSGGSLPSSHRCA
eukprot:scaffold16501_cov37-Prasinocladus_malaysianus.AAC.1